MSTQAAGGAMRASAPANAGRTDESPADSATSNGRISSSSVPSERDAPEADASPALPVTPPPVDADKRTHALFLASLALPVFRLKTNSKEPLEDGWTDTATTDPTIIRGWWNASDGSSAAYNIGIRTGQGWAALDFDCKPKRDKDGIPKLNADGTPVRGRGLDALAEFDMLEDLPNGYRQTTTTGGRHVILRLPEGVEVKNSAGKLRPDVDVRGHHGFVVGAGSEIDGVPYKWDGGTPDVMPAKFITWCGRPRERAEDTATPLVEPDQPRNVERAIRYLRDVAPEAIEGDGGNHTTFAVACAVKDLGISKSMCGDLMGEHWNEAGKAIPPWDHEDLIRVVENAYHYGKSPPGKADPLVDFKPDPDLDQPDTVGTADRSSAGMTTWPTPFEPFDVTTLPRRQWLYGNHYIRQFVSVTVAPGGVGKSALTLVEAIALATGRPLLGIVPAKRCRVWLWNGEDPVDELLRRVAAICAVHDVPMAELKGWLFLDSGRRVELKVAQVVNGVVTLNQGTLAKIEERITALEIDVAILDPFVSVHQVPENDNGAIDLVAKALARIADRTGCAIEIVHHTSKTRGEEVTEDSSRGASALINASRVTRVLNRMTADEARRLGVPEDTRRSFFRTDAPKANLAPPEGATWHRLVSVEIANGEHIGAVQLWNPPSPAAVVDKERVGDVLGAIRAGSWRQHDQSPQWVGRAIADALGLNLAEQHIKTQIKRLQADWTAEGILVELLRQTDKREMKLFVEVAEPTEPRCGDSSAATAKNVPNHPSPPYGEGVVRRAEGGEVEVRQTRSDSARRNATAKGRRVERRVA